MAGLHQARRVRAAGAKRGASCEPLAAHLPAPRVPPVLLAPGLAQTPLKAGVIHTHWREPV